MKIFHVIKEITEFIVEGETEDLAMDNFCNHGRFCNSLVQHSRSQSGCTGEKIEANDLLDAITKRQYK